MNKLSADLELKQRSNYRNWDNWEPFRESGQKEMCSYYVVYGENWTRTAGFEINQVNNNISCYYAHNVPGISESLRQQLLKDKQRTTYLDEVQNDYDKKTTWFIFREKYPNVQTDDVPDKVMSIFQKMQGGAQFLEKILKEKASK